MRIKSKNSNIASMKLIVPVDGIITIDEKGEVEVSTACAELLVNNTNDWQYAEGSDAEGKGGDDENDDAEGTENDAKNERELLEEKVKNAKVAELKEMCSELGFPEEEWKNLNKSLLAAYILKKYDETDETDEVEDEIEDEEEEED